ncbi:MAG: endonuclease/exonuclease/phosphatase family protein [Clostridia bacterium]|nr:endonuclease/exonuclease/phosphatase family protein [Clostridia bacterium]
MKDHSLRKIVIGIIVFIILLLVVGFSVLMLTEYEPEDIEELTVEGEATKKLKQDEDIKLLTYNLGYLSLDSTQDFFMDGGESVMPKTASNVNKNLAAIQNLIQNEDADIYLFQEVDYKAKRSYNMNQYEGLKKDFDGTATYAFYHKCLYIPYPIFNSVGHVESGMTILNKFALTATRIALPSAYSWPMRAVMFKRCLMVQRMQVENCDKELVVINLHLEAYDDGNTRLEQLEILKNLMLEEYEKGNYVIAGGDFNQKFPVVDNSKYPVLDDSHFSAATIPEDFLPEKWKYAVDGSKPTSRLLNEVYSGNYDNTQLYVIDGYILSPNVELKSVETIENSFSYSDHQPVRLTVKLKK